MISGHGDPKLFFMTNNHFFWQGSEIGAVIFDMDGTIVPNRDYHLHAWRKLCDEAGMVVTDGQLLKTFGSTNKEIFRLLLPYPVSDEAAANLADRKEQLYREAYHGKVIPTDGLRAFLNLLTLHSIPTALATSAPSANVKFTLTESQLDSSFGIITDSSDIVHGKPHPEIFLKTAQKLGIQPQHCLVFEDAPLGIEAARSAGMQVIALTTTFPSEQLQLGVQLIMDFSKLRFENNSLVIK